MSHHLTGVFKFVTRPRPRRLLNYRSPRSCNARRSNMVSVLVQASWRKVQKDGKQDYSGVLALSIFGERLL